MTTEQRVRQFVELAAAQRDAEFLTIKQVALLLGKADSTVREMVREDKLEAIKVGGHFRIIRESVIRWLDDINRN
jgi:excisionase family DNA binding protein